METVLHCTEGGSDKLYRVQIIPDAQGTYAVRCSNCRVGNPWVDQGYKIQGAILPAAEKEATKVINSKVKKGYVITSDGIVSPSLQGPPIVGANLVQASVERNEGKVQSGFRPQLLNTIDEDHARRLAGNVAWIGQEKHDGVRHTIYRKKGGTLQASNKLGIVTTPEQKVMVAFEAKKGAFLVDGELVGEVFYAFDLLELDGTPYLKDLPYWDRYLMLKEWLPQTENVKLVQATRGDTTIIDTLKAQGAEGVVFKWAMAVYQAGRPASGGDQFKFKFTNTASFIVTEQNGTKRSVALALLDDAGIAVPLGSCTIPANYQIPAAGAIVEVRYLYAYRGGSIFQPTYLGERNDILPAECLTSQLKFKGEGDDE